MPRVSVIIPTFNRSPLICRAIDSVLAQTYKDFEIIVVDDGSTDNTRDVLSRYNDNIRYIYQQNGGAAKARNVGIQASLGEFITFLDSDDAFLPRKLEQQVAFLEVNSEIDIVLCGWREINGVDGLVMTEISTLPVEDILATILFTDIDGLYPPIIALSRRSCIVSAGGFDESFSMHEEQELWMRLALEGCRYGMIEEVLCNYYNSPNTLGKNVDRLEEIMPRILEKVFTHPGLSGPIRLLRSEVYARMYLHLCVYYLYARNLSRDDIIDLEKRYLTKAFANVGDPSNWRPDTYNSFLYNVIQTSPDCPETILEMIMENLINPRVKSFLRSRLQMIFAFEAYQSTMYSEVLKAVWRAAWYAPNTLKDKGLRSILLKSLIHQYVK